MSALAAPLLQRSITRETLTFAIGRTSLGLVAVAESERGICAVALGDDEEALAHELATNFPHAVLQRGAVAALEGVRTLIEDPSAPLSVPLDPRGTPFQQRVWEALRQIPVGQTTTYSQLAENIGAASAVRAVASACAANKLALIIPCHRVIRLTGELAGFRWGVERKRALLAREAAAVRLHSA